MNSNKRIGLDRVALLAALFCAGPVMGQEQGAAAPAGAVAATPSVPSAGTLAPRAISESASGNARRTPFGSAPLASTMLGAKRGGERVVNDNQLKGVVADNKASNLTTGMNVISEGAFAGSSGMPTVIQNSGNNVLIQNSTIVNVQLK
jgi:hypothetical protein